MKRIFLAITANNHYLFDACLDSILNNSVELMLAGHKVMPYIANDLYIDRSRNLCVDLFLKQDCTDLVFVDADLGFDQNAILKLMKHDKPIIAGAYPLKKSGLDFPITLRFDIDYNCKCPETGLVYATRVPTGLMRIQRHVFETLKDITLTDEENVYQFFRTGVVVEGDPNWWGEDSYFCKRWIDAGGEIFVEPDINFTHHGIQRFPGNYHEYLLGRSIDIMASDKNLTGPDGYMSDTELSVLKYLAQKSESVVEVGSWKGRSTKALLESCNGPVYAVDHWNGSAGDLTEDNIDLDKVYDIFIANVGDYPNLHILKGNSLDVAKDFGTADMVFIDAGHDYEEVKADIEAWTPKAKKIICGHDYVKDHGGVIQAVDETIGNVNVIDTIWFKEMIS